MDFKTEKNGDKLVVQVSGRLDAITASEFDAESRSWLDKGETNVVVDLNELEYISSAGLRSILTAAKQLKSASGTITFCGLTGMVDEVFAVSGFASMFPIFPTVDEALAG